MTTDGKSNIPCEKCEHPQTRIVWIRSKGIEKTYRLVCLNFACRHTFEAIVDGVNMRQGAPRDKYS